MTSKPNILLVVIDCLRADRVGTGDENSSMPFVSDLAQKGTTFRRAYSPASWTAPAHASFLTGKLPSEHGVHIGQPSLSNTPYMTLPEQLSSTGYETVAFSANPWFSDEFGFARGFDDFVNMQPSLPFKAAADPRALNWQGYDSRLARIRSNLSWIAEDNAVRRAVNFISLFRSDYPLASGENINEEMCQWLATRSDSSPFFATINYMDVHEPYRRRRLDPYLDEQVGSDAFDSNWNADALLNGVGANGPDDVRRIYDASTTLVDSIVEELFDVLRTAEELKDTLIVIVGDHGQALGEDGFWGHGFYLQEKLLHIPLIVYSEGNWVNLPSTVDREATLTDLPNYLATTANTDPLTQDSGTISPEYCTGDTCPKPILAQSYGIREHMVKELKSANIAVPEGSEVVHSEGWRGHHDCRTGEFAVMPANRGRGASTSAPAGLEDILTLDPCRETNLDETVNIDANIEQRLKDLGYK